MRYALLSLLLSASLLSCMPDIDPSNMCPPYEIIESRGVSDKHLKVLKCAGYKDYFLDQASVVYFVNKFPGQPKRILWANQECGFIAVVNYSRDYYTEQEATELECWCMIYGAYYLLNGTYEGSEIEADLFLQKIVDNDCHI